MLDPPDLDINGNIIAAGHLQVEINHADGSHLSLENMAPGEHRFAYQLVTGDMSGVAKAALSMTLFSADAAAALPNDDPGRLFAENASLAVYVSTPEPESNIDWSNGECKPTARFPTQPAVTFTHISEMTVDESSAHSIDLGSFTGTSQTAVNNAVCVKFDVALDSTAGNDVQDTTGRFSMSYSLTQTVAVDS